MNKILGEKNLNSAITFLKVSVDTRFMVNKMQKPMADLQKNRPAEKYQLDQMK